jgi:uncharacterized circularly permuted ATP-grasp superfamily protein
MGSDPELHALPGAFDEDRDEAGEFRPGYAKLFAALDGVDLAALSTAVAAHVDGRGVNFAERAFVVDPVPRLIPGPEWDALATGLAQRARALNLFLIDAYGEQRIVEAGIVSDADLRDAEGFEPDLLGRLPARLAPAAIIGFDVVRDPGGAFLVLEDNARTPSGFVYALAAREALLDVLPPGCPEPRPIDPDTYELIADVLRAAAPEGCADPSIVILTDGPNNVAYAEHSRTADRLDVPLVTLDDLIADGENLRIRLPSGRERGVDVLYRRCDEDRVRDERSRMTSVAELLLPSWLSGRLGLVNAFGNGLADDKLVHGHVEDFVRFYLEEEPLVPSVPTSQPSDLGETQEAVERLRELVVKPRHGHGGKGVVIGPHADHADLELLADELDRNPDRYISQPVIALSRHPTVIAGALEPRHIDLRTFTFTRPDGGVGVMPGGLSRVALEENTLVVNSSQDGGGKDTWVI